MSFGRLAIVMKNIALPVLIMKPLSTKGPAKAVTVTESISAGLPKVGVMCREYNILPLSNLCVNTYVCMKTYNID